MSATSVKPCACKNTFQDKEYGAGNRLHNIADKKKVGSAPSHKCTVCGATRT